MAQTEALKSAMKIVICNDGVDSPNKGDQAILQSMLADFSAYFPGVELEAYSFSGTRSPRKIWTLLKAIRGADVFVLGGGHPFQDLTSQCFLLFALFLLGAARLCRTPSICYAIGAGPVVTGLGRRLIPLVLNRTAVICVRDRISGEVLRGLGVDPRRIVQTADAAFGMAVPDEARVNEICEAEQIRGGKKIVAVCLRRWFCFRGGFLPHRPDLDEARANPRARQSADNFVEFLNGLLEAEDVEILFVPTRRAGAAPVAGQDDDLFSQEILDRLKQPGRARLLQGDYTPQELKAILGKMSLVVSVRMHAVIFAASLGVPVLGIAISHAKGQGIFEKLGLPPQCYVPIEEAQASTLLEKSRWILEHRDQVRALLAGRRDQLVRESRRNLEELGHLLPSEK